MYSNNTKKYEFFIHYILQKLRNTRLYYKMEKYIFHRIYIDFLRYIILKKKYHT